MEQAGFGWAGEMHPQVCLSNKKSPLFVFESHSIRAFKSNKLECPSRVNKKGRSIEIKAPGQHDDCQDDHRIDSSSLKSYLLIERKR